MNWKAQRPAIETAAEWIAALAVAGALGFALWALAPGGVGMVAAPAAAAVGGFGARFVLGRVDRRGGSDSERFVPVAFDEGDEVLLLDDPVETEPLLLDDALPAIAADSRVVRLFAAPPVAGDMAPPLPAPGEMAAQIDSFLGGARPVLESSAPDPAAAADASAALHAALADIRRSLRRA